MSAIRPRTALVLGGGGARAAYEAGVLDAVRCLLPDATRNPFAIYCGASTGAINAAAMAVHSRDFAAGVTALVDLWSTIHVDDVFHVSRLGLAAGGLRWLLRQDRHALFDNAPLRQLLARHIDFAELEPAVAAHAVLALVVTCSGYASGQSVSFFQGRADLESWSHGQRVGAHVLLGVEHLMASTALPLLFPAVRMNREYFGDGALRQGAPLAPALHLGAEKLMVVADGHPPDDLDTRAAGNVPPSLARIVGQVFTSIHTDALANDIEHVRRLDHPPPGPPAENAAMAAASARPVRLLVMTPSRRPDHLAAEHFTALPSALRSFLTRIGAAGASGREDATLTSLLLFEPAYTRALIDLGRRDTLARADDLRDFFEIT